eukprot:gene9562-10569_t
MGNGALIPNQSKRKKRLSPEERRPPLTTTKEIQNSVEAQERIRAVMKAFLPGVTNRWQKIIQGINREIEPTDEEPDPLRIQINEKELKEILQNFFQDVQYISSDGLALTREYMPKLYNQHTIERCEKLSMIERISRDLRDDIYAYGEIDYEIFATIYLKLISVYGALENGIFYDLGCGVGTLVYTAAFIGNFQKVAGVELLSTLLERGQKRRPRWEKMRSNFTKKIQGITFEWIEDNFIENDFWTEGTFLFLHWTAFSYPCWKEVSQMMSNCVEGTQVITFTNPIDSPDFDLLLVDNCDTSWGKTEFYLHEKITPSRRRQ